MTISEIQAEKALLERELRRALSGYEEKTGTQVTSVLMVRNPGAEVTRPILYVLADIALCP